MANKQLTDKQFEIVCANIERIKADYEEDSFSAGYISAMLTYGIISGKQYENRYK